MKPKKADKAEKADKKPLKVMKKSPKSEKKVKIKSSKSPRIESQPKSNVLTADRICNRCKVHDMIRSVKGHKCPDDVLNCKCDKCLDYVEKTRRKNENRKRRQNEKNASKEKVKPDSKTFINSLKNKSKKILQSSSKKKGRKNGKKTVKNGSVPIIPPHLEGLELPNNDDTPPSLQRQSNDIPQDDALDAQSSSTTDINQSNPTDNEGNVTKSSAPLCAKYLKDCEEFSRKLSKYQLTQDEMIACFKYSMVRDCLGDVDLAAQKIAFASQEIRLGAVYNIQNPSAGQKLEQRAHGSTSNTAPVLCSTYNTQYVPPSGVHYSPSFTPIRR